MSKPKHPLLANYNGMKLSFKSDIWTVRIVKHIDDDSAGIVVGLCDWMEQEILILQGIGREKTHQTFWHEVGHVLEWYYRFDLKHEHIDKIGDGLKDLFSLNRQTLNSFFK